MSADRRPGDLRVPGRSAAVEPLAQVPSAERAIEHHDSAPYNPGSSRRLDRLLFKSRVARDRERWQTRPRETWQA